VIEGILVIFWKSKQLVTNQLRTPIREEPYTNWAKWLSSQMS